MEERSFSPLSFASIHELEQDLNLADQAAAAPKAPAAVSAGSNREGDKTQNYTPKPRRALSAYNYFFQHERNLILASLPNPEDYKRRRSHGKIGFAELARKIAAEWKVIDAQSKKRFQALAAQDKVRFQRELEEWKLENNIEDNSQPKKTEKSKTTAQKVPAMPSSSLNEMLAVRSQNNDALSSNSPPSHFQPSGLTGVRPIPVGLLQELLQTWDDECLDFFIDTFR